MSTLFTLDWKDLLNGLIMAIVGNVVFYLLAIFANLYQLVMNNQPFEVVINWESILVIAIFSSLTYLSKRFISNKDGTILGSN